MPKKKEKRTKEEGSVGCLQQRAYATGVNTIV
jgi:hypothetical protein